MSEFYHTLKDLRKEKGFTIREVAGRSGVSPAYISQLENGQRGVPSPDVLLKLADGLNISYARLMQAAGYLEPLEAAQPGGSRPINLRHLLHDAELQFDGLLLSETDKRWLERVLAALFWRETTSAHEPPESRNGLTRLLDNE